ncbi:MAG: hypothetical protein ACI83H_001843 [Glaciecola sp.]|jgi:hypothetical protein
MRIKSNYIVVICLITLGLIINSCFKDDVISRQEQETLTKALYKQRTVSLKDIPKIEQKVIEKLNPEVFNRTESTNQAIFETDNILEVIDTLNNVNYSFQFRFPNTPSNVFYNLVVGETPNGDVLTPYVMRYECDDAYLEQYISNDLDFAYFVGAIARHKYTDFFELGEFDRTVSTLCPPEFDEVGDPISCIETTFNGGNGGTDTSDVPGDDGDPGDGNTGGGGGSELSCYVPLWQCVHRGELHASPNDCNETELGGDWILSQVNCNNPTSPAPDGETGRTVEDDCPSCPSPEGGIAINTNLIFEARTALKHNLNLSFDAIEWIGDDDNEELVKDLYEFLEENKDIDGNYPIELETYTSSYINALGSSDFSSFFALDIFIQDPYDIWNGISQEERDLIKNFPTIGYSIYKNREIAESTTFQKFGFNRRNDKSDAYRHAYYNVINAKKVGAYYAKLFSDAHESETPIHLIKEKEMDLFNNNVGHQTIIGYINMPNDELGNLIYQKLLNGELRYLSPLDSVVPPFFG